MTSLKRRGAGLVNTLINKLPFEIHLPTYSYCGPGTDLEKRLARGDPGINPLDKACKEHDIAYSRDSDLKHRHEADRLLQERAWSRVKSKDASFGEKIAAWSVTNAMKAKRNLGMGLKRRSPSKSAVEKRINTVKAKRKLGMGLKRRLPFKTTLVKRIKNALSKMKPTSVKEGAKLSLNTAKLAVRDFGGKRCIRTPRIIPLPKTGGFLPLIPLFAALSALGGLAGGAAGIAQAVNKSKAAQHDLLEAQRHNKTMEAIALGKKGDGLYLKPYRKGLGLYLKSYSQRQKTKNF